ncbi:MAG: carbamoyltransferase [Parcubacteria group bacterium]|nr:carbamoyltransferase [Parcubacteria group bacterium]
MRILGINQVANVISWQHDAAAALVVDGKIIATAEEERFNRVRHARGFPTRAISYCLKEGGLELTDIDVIAVGYNPFGFIEHGRIPLHPVTLAQYIANIFIYQRKLKVFAKQAGAKVMYIDHHMAHAASTYHCSGFDEANVLTIDGAGETETFAYFEGKNGTLKRIWDIPLNIRWGKRVTRSIGLVYTSVTTLLNLGVSAEGKTMGLASYGKPVYDFSQILSITDHTHYTINRANVQKLYGNLGRTSAKGELTQVHKDLAASLQHALEEGLVNLAREAYERSGVKNFALAGGVALNCNTNQRILDQDFCEGLYVIPAAHDGGVALGAALSAAEKLGEKIPLERLETAYLGPEYSDEEIEVLLKEAKVAYEHCDNIESRVADLLEDGKIVGWFQGRMEMGPRALCNRTILANPTMADMADRVNADVKHREKWRPFAPAVALEDAATYFTGLEKEKESPFMLRVSYVQEAYKDKLPATTHFDGSARIQTIKESQNPRAYKLLQEVKKRSGMSVVMNTSFNDNSEPIVCSPKDALRCFYGTGFDALALGSFLIVK